MINLHSIQAGMMKGKTMAVAVCISVCTLGAEAALLPAAMDSSYERYTKKYGPVIAEDRDAVQILTDEKRRPYKPPMKPPPRPQTGGKSPVS